MKRTTIMLIAWGFVCAPLLSKAQGAFDPILTFPPSPGPAYVDTGKYIDPVYKPTLSNADFRIKTHLMVKRRKLSDKEEFEKRRKEEDKAWQDFINQPASIETKMAPKYINTKTGK